MIVERFEILRARKIDSELWLIGLGLPLAIVGMLIAIVCMVYGGPVT